MTNERRLLPKDNKLYVVTRADITPGQQAAQVAHAVIENAYLYDTHIKQWRNSSNYIVVVEAPDGKALERIQLKALHRGILSTPFTEPELNNEITAIAFPPSPAVRRLLGSYPLAGKGLLQDTKEIQND